MSKITKMPAPTASFARACNESRNLSFQFGFCCLEITNPAKKNMPSIVGSLHQKEAPTSKPTSKGRFLLKDSWRARKRKKAEMTWAMSQTEPRLARYQKRVLKPKSTANHTYALSRLGCVSVGFLVTSLATR